MDSAAKLTNMAQTAASTKSLPQTVATDNWKSHRKCDHCMKEKFREVYKRFIVKPSTNNTYSDVASCRYNRNFTYSMSNLIVKLGRVHVELSLSGVSPYPLTVYIHHNRLLIDVDNSRRYCRSCKILLRVKDLCPLGYFMLPSYIDPSSITLRFASDRDVLICEGSVKGAVV